MNYVIFKADGSVNKQNFEYYVQQGDNNNQFFIGLAGGLASDSAVGVCVLPNGSTNVISGVWNANYEYAEGETADGWLFSLTTDQTEYSGLLQVSLYVSRGPTIKVSYPIGIIINETGVRPDTDTGITIEELNSYLVELQKYALKDHVIYLENLLTSSDTLQTVGTGPHFIKMSDDEDGTFYFITIKDVGSGYDFSAINLSDPKKYYHGVVPSSTTLGMALSSTFLDELVDLVSEQTITGKKTLASTGDITPATGSAYEVGSSSKPYNNVNTNSVNSISVSSFENKNNKVVSINGSSTDTQYPSAKAVWDTAQDVREVAEGKCKSYVIDDTQVSLTSSFFNGTNKVYKTNGDEIATWADFQTYVNNGTCANADFAVQTSQVNIVNKYILTNEKVVIINLDSGMHTGDIILVKQLNVPDRWFEPGIPGVHSDYYNILETTKVDLSSYYSKSESLISTGNGTYDIGGSGAYWGKAYITDELYIKSLNGNYVVKLSSDNNGYCYFTDRGFQTFRIKEDELYIKKLLPWASSGYSIGDSSNPWDSVYTAAIKNGNVTYQEFAGGHTVVYGRLRPGANGTVDSGQSNFKWASIWGTTLKGFTTISQADYDALVSGGTVDADTFYFIEEE